MYKSTGKPSIAKFKARLHRIREASSSGALLARAWNPKGRYFKIQRDMIAFFDEAEKRADEYLAFLQR